MQGKGGNEALGLSHLERIHPATHHSCPLLPFAVCHNYRARGSSVLGSSPT